MQEKLQVTQRTATYVAFALWFCTLALLLSGCPGPDDIKPRPNMEPTIEKKAPADIQKATAEIRKDTKTIKDTATKVAAENPTVPGVQQGMKTVTVSAESVEKQTGAIDVASAAITKNQQEIIEYITKERARDADLQKQYELAIKAKEVKTSEALKQLAEEQKKLEHAEKRIVQLEDATNSWIARITMIGGIFAVALGIFDLFQFPAFYKTCMAIIGFGICLEVSGVVLRQLLVWSRELTCAFTILCAVGLVALVVWIALKYKQTAAEVVEGTQTIKDKLTGPDLAAFVTNMQLVTDQSSKRIISHVKAAGKIGSFKNSKDTRPWWQRLLGIGVPTPAEPQPPTTLP